MPREDNSISASELEVMRVLWAAGEPLSIAEIRESLSDTGWEASTIKTLVARLVKKGELVQSKRGVYYYSPAVSREEYGSGAARRLAEKLYGGGLTKLFASFVEGGEFTAASWMNCGPCSTAPGRNRHDSVADNLQRTYNGYRACARRAEKSGKRAAHICAVAGCCPAPHAPVRALSQPGERNERRAGRRPRRYGRYI